jgi:putative ABC transport system permease protein
MSSRRELAKLGALFRRPRPVDDLEEEIRSHLEMEEQDNLESGMPPDEAHYAALRRFGNVTLAEERSREMWGWNSVETLLQDLRYGLRMLRKNPGFAAVAVLTLALGIGANTAIFSMVNGIMLRALPYDQSQQLYVINEQVPQFTSQSPWGPWFPVNAGNYLQWQGDRPAVSSMALIGPATFNMTGEGVPRQVNGVRVSAEFFPMMGIRPQLGRAFLPEEDALGLDHEVILSAQFWRQVFSSDPRIIGKAIVLDNAPYTVVGITPDSFGFPQLPLLPADAPELFKPIGLEEWAVNSGLGGFNFAAIARLRDGASPQQALAQINAVEARIAQRGDAMRHIAPGEFDLRATLRPLKTVIIGPAQRALWMLMAAAGFVLLIICVNLANLVLVRNIGRAHEVAVRSALGASARRLARQFFAEGLILAAAGGGVGLLLAVGGLQLLVRNAPVTIPRIEGIRVDVRVLLFTMGVSIFTSVLVALLPALRLVRLQPVEALKSAVRTAGGGQRSVRLRGVLVVSQIALCGVLLAGALLLIESLRHVARANQWMDEQRVLAVDLSIPPNESHTSQQANEFLTNVLERVRALPGVQSAGFTNKLPLLGPSFGDDIDFREAPKPPNKPQIGEFRFISPGYFQALGLPLVRGRLLSEGDRDKDVCLISESVAQRLLPGRDPIGMHLMWGQGEVKPREIIGEVADVRNASDEPDVLAVYLPLWTFYQTNETLIVRAAMDLGTATDSIRRAVWSVDPEVAIPRERTLQTVVRNSEATRSYETFLGAVFAAFAVLLAALGLYGVVSYSVGQRTHEIGIRIALGAERRVVLRMVLGQGLKLAIVGVGIGIAAALGLTRSLSSLLYGVGPNDPLTFGGVSLILISVALGACYIPARRATKVDPMVALRYE